MISAIKPRAMTLIEVLVATTLLGVGVTALLSAATLGLRNQQRSELRAMALCVAQEKLSEIELLGAHVWLLARPTSGDTERGPQNFHWTTQIEQQLIGELFTVDITVDWVMNGGGTVQLSTWLNDYAASELSAPRENKNANATKTPSGK